MLTAVIRHIRGNVVAYLALFFALGGGAMAANTYIRSTDTIPSGDLAGSTYGSPVIASGAVTTGKLGNGAVTNGKLANSSLSVNTDGTTLTGGGAITLGGSNSTPLGVANGGISTTQLHDSAVTTSKFDPSAQAPDSAKLGGASPSDFGAVLTGRLSGISGLAVGPVSGNSTAGGTVSSVGSLSPNHDLKMRDLSVRVTTAPGAGKDWVLDILGFDGGGGGTGAIGCVVSGTATSCTAAGPVDVPAGTTLVFLAEGDGSPPTIDALFGFRLTNS
jgi:hypothetical protein